MTAPGLGATGPGVARGAARGRSGWRAALALAVVGALAGCGAAPRVAEGPAAAQPVDRGRAEIAALASAIDADLAALDLQPPPVPGSACVEPPCDAQRLAVPAPEPAAAAACRAPVGARCEDACRLSAAICDRAARICRIAGELGGADAYANERCAAGGVACEAARARCCGCEP
jgi:hypothetical protein